MELAINLLIAILALSFIIVGYFRFAAEEVASTGPRIGDHVQISDFDWTRSSKNILIFLKPGCEYCTASSNFYRRVIETAKDNKVNLLIILPETAETYDAVHYLTSLGIAGSEFRYVSFDKLNVAGTPTLIVADNAGRISSAWLGQLPFEKELEVLGTISSAK